MAAFSPLLKRLLSRCSMTAPSRIIHTNATSDFRIVHTECGIMLVNPPLFQQKHTAEGHHLRIDMPGMSKEDVEFRVVDNKLIIKGEGEFGREIRSEFQLPKAKLYNVKAIKAEMKNGVLTAFLPKRTDVLKVNIE